MAKIPIEKFVDGKLTTIEVELDENGRHCYCCYNICSFNENTKYHPDDEIKYKQRMTK